MGKVDRLCNRVEPFAALFWALSIISTVQYLLTHLTLPVGLASLHRRTQSMPLYSMIQFSTKTRWHPPFSYLARRIIDLCGAL